MSEKTIGIAKFKATCLRVIDSISQGREAITITKRGHPVAVLMPISNEKNTKSIFGLFKDIPLRFDDPFAPATDISDWLSEE
ncbi:MAG: type II toxin-antitoxin system Phd/YefM family antitoxin [Robiginitomaculum sp.]|nr:type II toxin-antitoxin system Phd/YefM family antitoxin [Robiginitomaculum sp.]